MLQPAIKIVNFPLFQNHLIRLKKYWIFFLGISFNCYLHPVFAQSKHNIAINQNTIKQSLTVQGMSGGTINALEITRTKNTSTGYCDGFANRQPNHILKLDNFFEYLRLEIESSADTTILVRGAGGVWCNDDAGSANPVIEGQWQPGTYQVWVGSYRANSQHNYTIKITGR